MSYLYKDERRILLIDADVRKRNLRTAVLGSHEFEVHTAASLMEATPLWKTIPYDLVLLADPQHADSAALITQMRDLKPSQRIGLLVGPPSYIQEVARISAKTKSAQRRLVGSIPSPPVEGPAASQWQKTIYTVVSEWYAAQAGAFRPSEGTNPTRPNPV